MTYSFKIMVSSIQRNFFNGQPNHSIFVQFCPKNEKFLAAYTFHSLQTSNKLIVVVVHQVVGLAIVEVCKDANLLAWNFIGGQILSPHRIIVRKYFECERSIVFRKLILHKRQGNARSQFEETKLKLLELVNF